MSAAKTCRHPACIENAAVRCPAWMAGVCGGPAAPAPVAQPASRMSATAKRKAADLMTQGYEVAGYVLEKEGNSSAVLWDAAVRWITPEERHRLMHVEGSLAAPAPVAYLWRYVGRDPYPQAVHGKKGGPIARHVTEMDPKRPPYPEWEPVAPLYTHSAPAPVAHGEPVAWRVEVDGILFHARSREGLIDAIGVKLGRSVAAEKVAPLYAAPAPVLTPAQALTDEQIDKMLEAERMRWSSRNGPPTYEFALAFARAIERAHGIEATGQEGGKDHG